MSGATDEGAVRRELGAGAGLASALGAYVLWGVFPLYFLLLAPAGSIEIVCWRILFSLVFCAVLLAATRSFGSLRLVTADRRSFLLLGLAGVLILVNWLTFVIATQSGQVVQAALGYFLTPIITVVLGLLFGERLRPLQWVSIGTSVVAAIVLATGAGGVPWLALLLALSFGFYGLVKQRVGPRVTALTGLALETAWVTPLAAAGLAWIAIAHLPGAPDPTTGHAPTGVVFGTVSLAHTLLLCGSGVATAIPLLLFAVAARRLPLVTLGLTQYVVPILQLLVGVVVLRETMPLQRWIGFGLVWIALVLLTVDALAAWRTSRSR